MPAALIPQCVRWNGGRWGFSWEAKPFPVVTVVYGILVFPYQCFFFFFFNGKLLNLSLFSIEASIWQAFELLQPARSVQFVCVKCNYGQQNNTKWKTTFPVIISSDLFDIWPWDTHVKYSDSWYFTAKSYFPWDRWITNLVN